MIPRKLVVDFEDVPLVWSTIPEFAVDLNSGSPVASQSEPYLNTVMSRCRATGKLSDALAKDVDLFVRQETNHFTVHNRFNAEMYRRGYKDVRAIEMQLRDDFRSMLAKKSLKFNAAYCAGFENLALFLCKFVFSKAQGYFEGGDQRMVDLYLWHHAEEFEHRSVAHDVFAAVSGNYFRRAWGALYSFFHLAKYKGKMKAEMLRVERQKMSKEEYAQSVKRQRKLDLELALFLLPRMLVVLVPFYDPARTAVPRVVQDALDRYEAVAA